MVTFPEINCKGNPLKEPDFIFLFYFLFRYPTINFEPLSMRQPDVNHCVLSIHTTHIFWRRQISWNKSIILYGEMKCVL